MKSRMKNEVYVEIDGVPTQNIQHLRRSSSQHATRTTPKQSHGFDNNTAYNKQLESEHPQQDASSYSHYGPSPTPADPLEYQTQYFQNQVSSYGQPVHGYPQQEPIPAFHTGYIQLPVQPYQYAQANSAQQAQQTQYVRQLPQIVPPPPPRESAKRPLWRRPLLWVMSIALLGGVVAFSAMNLDKIIADAPSFNMPALGIDLSEDDATASEFALVEEPVNTAIIAEAFVRPARQADLSLTTAGLISQIYVEEGSEVEAGQLLLTLDSSQQLVAVAKAKANLAQAEARLNELVAGSRSEELLAAQAVVETAKANLESLRSQSSAVDEQAALAQLRAAQSELNALYREPVGGDVIAARAELKNAEAAVQRTQNAYNQVKWRNDAGMLQEAQDLQEATNNYEAAQAKFDALYSEPTPNEISQAQAAISEATAELERVRNPTKPGDIEAAEAEVRKAEAELRLLQSGTRPEVLAFTQAELDAAQASLLEAEVALTQTELKAPFDGTIVSLNAEVGEYLQPGVLIAQIGDLTHWQLETNDLIELDVINVALGAPVQISIDAMPDLSLTGKVIRTRKIGENKVGDITYTVYIEPDEYVPNLAWNMTASVHIDKGESP